MTGSVSPGSASTVDLLLRDATIVTMNPDVQLALTELERLHSRCASDRIVVAAEPMAMHRVNPDLLRDLHVWTVGVEVSFAMHIAYSREAAQYPIDEHGGHLLRVIEEWGILDERFLGYHAVWLDAEEIETPAHRDAGVSLCSAANMLIGAAAAPLQELLAASVRVASGRTSPTTVTTSSR